VEQIRGQKGQVTGNENVKMVFCTYLARVYNL